MAKKQGAITVGIPARAVDRWNELRALCAAEAGFQPPDSAVIELAIKIALENLSHVPGIGLVMAPERHAQFSLHRPGVDMTIEAGGHVVRRLAPGEDPMIEGEPIRPVPEHLRKREDA